MDHVLKTSGYRPPRDVYHHPDPENPDRPKCDHAGRKDIDFQRKDPEALPNHRLCKMCSGDVEYNPQEGTRPSTRLKNMDPSEVGL